MSSTTATVTKDVHHDLNIFPDILRDLTEIVDHHNLWFARALTYNVPKGKQNRLQITVLIYKNLMEAQGLKAESLKLAHILGWCIEMLNASLLISDDVMDNGSTRHGQICWAQLDDVGLNAVNDAFMIENAIYALLRKYFRNLDCYLEVMEVFREISLITACGQNLDMLSAKNSVTSFTMETFNAIATNKTSYYTFYMPFVLALHLAGFKDKRAFRESTTILLEMGRFYQIQNDYWDCFANPEITGKIGSDIQDNKCTWFAVRCLQVANDEQKQIMFDCYGKNDPLQARRVKELYETLGLPDLYAAYEDESYHEINTHIQQMSDSILQQILLNILKKIYQKDS